MAANEMKEVIDRVRRIETRLMTLGAKLGHNLKDEDGVHVDPETGDVDIDHMDISVSSIVRMCRQAGVHGRKVTVRCREAVITTTFQV